MIKTKMINKLLQYVADSGCPVALRFEVRTCTVHMTIFIFHYYMYIKSFLFTENLQSHKYMYGNGM